MRKKIGWLLGIGLVLGILGCGPAGEENGLENVAGSDSEFDLSQSHATALNTKIKTKPALEAHSTTAKFTFACNQSPCTFKCSLDSAAWKTCTSPKTYKKLKGGDHNFQVKAIKSGKTDKTPAGYDWTISDVWLPVSATNAPLGVQFSGKVWTNTEVIIWGGFDDTGVGDVNYGAKYDPATDSWTATSSVNAPEARDYFSTVWDTVNSQMIVWGGRNTVGTDLNTGARYNPASNSWTPTNTTNAPDARDQHNAVWTGTEMIIWAGSGVLNTGGKYDPTGNSWTATSTTNAPGLIRFRYLAFWTGSEMLIWGGFNGTNFLNSGGKYNPATNSWTDISSANAPAGRDYPAGVWTGTEMIVWGGYDTEFLNTGGVYDLAGNSWTATSTGTNVPAARNWHSAVWDTVNSQMIIWGGVCDAGNLNTGGKYDPDTDSWTSTSTVNAPSGRGTHVAVWAEDRMIIWGGTHAAGGRYWP